MMDSGSGVDRSGAKVVIVATRGARYTEVTMWMLKYVVGLSRALFDVGQLFVDG